MLERRLNLSAFPDLETNPVVRLLALGAKATGKDQIVEGEFDPKGARSRPDRIQALAVKASLGGSSFVLEGPPGTGKTQTIVAMVEALAKQGKRVLVSAAMPGAVGVIQSPAAVASCHIRHLFVAARPDRSGRPDRQA